MGREVYYLVVCLGLLAILLPVIVFSFSKSRGTTITFQVRPENDTSYLSRYYQVKLRSVNEIYEYLKDLTRNNSFFCQLRDIGFTSKKGFDGGLPVYLLKLSSGFPKPIILIIGGINGNDWAASTSVLYVVNQLLANCTKAGQLLTTYDFHFIPILNPDGYNYSRATPIAAQWIKNIARWSMEYMGVNIDYNFGTNWETHYNFHEDTFAGVGPFSEDESQILRDYIDHVKNYIELTFILKSPTNITPTESAITYPWSYTSSKVFNWVLLEYLSVAGAQAAYAATGTKYKVIQSGIQVKDQHGRIDDWLYSVGVKNVLTIQTKFTTDVIADPYDSIIKTGTEVFAIIKEIGITAFYQPMSYRKTNRRLRIDEEVAYGVNVLANSSSQTTTTDMIEERDSPKVL